MRLVLDTNVVVAALLWSGSPNRLIELAAEDQIEFVTFADLLAELAGVLSRRKFAHKFAERQRSAAQVIAFYAELAKTVIPASIARTVMEDIDDDAVIACAIAASADLIVSGDHHLLDLKEHQGMRIVSAAEAPRLIEGVPR